jgi:insulysin
MRRCRCIGRVFIYRFAVLFIVFGLQCERIRSFRTTYHNQSRFTNKRRFRQIHNPYQGTVVLLLIDDVKKCNSDNGGFMSNFPVYDGSDRLRRDILKLGPPFVASLSGLCDAASPANAKTAIDTTVQQTRAFGQTTNKSDLPFSSVRTYKTVHLPENGLRVILVSDKLANRAQCAITIEVGQFNDPHNLPGLAHLMEHMILSSNTKSPLLGPHRDFEDWLADREGASNAFTANQRTCFHFTCSKLFLPEALERFAGLFMQREVENICRDSDTLRREVRRVDAELDFQNVNAQVEYITKAFVNLEHPYSRFSRGSLDSLELFPAKQGVDVSESLVDFFHQYYLPSKAVLTVVSPQDVSSLERWVSSFGYALSRHRKPEGSQGYFPGQFLLGKRYKHLVLYRQENPDENEKLIVEWVINQDYRNLMRGRNEAIAAPQIGFVLSQMLCRRGPGSFYAYLLRRGWTRDSSSAIPRISLPVDASGFQILKLEITLTIDGFINRASIVTALYDSIEVLRNQASSFVVPREIMAQYATSAKLFGYILAPRPPDAVELSFDALLYGTESVGSGQWYRFPVPEDLSGLGLNFLRRTVATTLAMMVKRENALIIVTAGDTSIAKANEGLQDSVRPLTSFMWRIEPISGARFYFEEMAQLKSKVEQLVLAKIVTIDELAPPVFNTYVPTVIRRPQRARRDDRKRSATFTQSSRISNRRREWFLVELALGQRGLPLPRSSPEPNCRCSFVVQLLSSRPARADFRQAARAELWKLSFFESVVDLAELGAPGGLAYDVSFNKFGLRLSFLGISQTLPSYTRRITRRLLQHHLMLFDGPSMLSSSIITSAIFAVNNAPGLSFSRRRSIVSSLRSSKACDVAVEGRSFLQSCSGAIGVVQGDLLPDESSQLLLELQAIFDDAISTTIGQAQPPATPTLNDILYKPVWKPRYASACSIAGVSLISDACGRVPR